MLQTTYTYRKNTPENFFFTGNKTYEENGKWNFLYEKDNHLGNVLVVVSDRKIPVDDNNDGTIDYYTADILVTRDFYPGGSPMPGRNFNSTDYRYGFNSQEKDDEISGNGNSYTAEFWQYDSRLGRRWNIDPVVKVWESGYATFNNNPILQIDPNGDNAGEYVKYFNPETKSYNKEKISTKGDDEKIDTYEYSGGSLNGQTLTLNKNNKTASWAPTNSSLGSVSINPKLTISGGPVSSGAGLSFESNSETFATSVVGDASASTEGSIGLGASLDVGFSFSNKPIILKNGSKETLKVSEQTGINLFGNGVFAKTELDIKTGVRTYKFGIKLGAKAETPMTNKFTASIGIKNTAASDYSLLKSNNFRLQ
ncbi:MAG: hypothetical protein H0V01_04720 [Bacteroidetes bacterium]|nr:hypothetical protein [Bacteroidota bacterium]HET6242983.1 hypothetical protein [Bacteroidia bacterium]